MVQTYTKNITSETAGCKRNFGVVAVKNKKAKRKIGIGAVRSGKG